MKNDSFRKRLTEKLWYTFRDLFYAERVEDMPVIQNINLTATRPQKKAIISYLTTSYIADWSNQNIGRTQPLEILSIVKVLSDLDYTIDIVNCNDLNALPIVAAKEYDLIFGFGEVFYQLTLKHPNAMSIIYMTEHHPDFADREEKKRIAYFYERHRKKARIVRSGNFYKPHYFDQRYSAVITMSEVEPYLKDYENLFAIFPTGMMNTNFLFDLKDHNTARKHFLWLGSYGAVHKGLDLLLDVFENREDIVLHIAGLSEEDEKLLKPKKKRNIINHGYLDIQSTAFLDVVARCSFIILLSCSEACSTSITTGMVHGLIPVVMKDTGFNRLDENAIFLDDFKISYLDEELTKISEIPASDLQIFSKKVYDFARQYFVLNFFESKLKKIMNTVLETQKHD